MESCIIQLTSAAKKHGNLNIRPCGRDFFPSDVFGSSSKKSGLGNPIILRAEGIAEPIKTDIPTDRKTDKPRWMFRERKWLKEFIHRHRLNSGDAVVIERISIRTYEIKPKNKKSSYKTNIYKEAVINKSSSLTTVKRSRNNLNSQQSYLPYKKIILQNSKLDTVRLDARKQNIQNSPKNG